MATPAEPSPAETPADPMRPPQALVKLYMLNDETTWDVVGTGFVSILNPDGSLCSLSRAEDSGAGVGDGAPDTVAMDATSTAADENVNPPQDGDEAAAAGGTAAAGEVGDDAGENASGSDGSSDGDGGGDGGDDGGSEAPKPGRPDIPPESTSAYRLVVLANDADAVMLDTNVHSEDVYQLQQNTLIVWNEPQSAMDLAISFQNSSGCQEIWDRIMAVQSQPDAFNLTPIGNGGMFEGGRMGGGGFFGKVEFPPVKIANLGTILSTIQNGGRDRVAAAVLGGGLVEKLIDIFDVVEDLDNKEALTMLYHIFRSLVMLNDSNLIDTLFSSDNIESVIGVLEYDPDVAARPQHREFLENKVVFKTAVPFSDPALVEKIHQTFRITFIKDVVLPRVLDDATFAALNSIIFFNNVDILAAIQEDADYLDAVFARLQADDAAADAVGDLVMFLQELCNMTKALNVQRKVAFYGELISRGLFPAMLQATVHEDLTVRAAAFDILGCAVACNAQPLREFLIAKDTGNAFFLALVAQLQGDPDTGIKIHITELFKVLLDSASLDEQGTTKEQFLNIFYQKVIQALAQPFSDDLEPVLANGAAPVAADAHAPDVEADDDDNVVRKPKLPPYLIDVNGPAKNHICDLLTFCVMHHTYRIKYFVLGRTLTKNILKMMGHRETYLALAALRFFRALVASGEDFYHRFIVKNDLMGPIVDRYAKNRRRNNVFTASFYDMIAMISDKRFGILVTYLMDKYYERLSALKDHTVFEGIRVAAVEIAGGGNNSESLLMAMPERRRGRGWHRTMADAREAAADEEEAFFSMDDGDDEADATGVAVPASGNPNAAVAVGPMPALGSMSDSSVTSTAAATTTGADASSDADPPMSPSSRARRHSMTGDDETDDGSASAESAGGGKRQRVSLDAYKKMTPEPVSVVPDTTAAAAGAASIRSPPGSAKTSSASS